MHLSRKNYTIYRKINIGLFFDNYGLYIENTVFSRNHRENHRIVYFFVGKQKTHYINLRILRIVSVASAICLARLKNYFSQTFVWRFWWS